MQSQSTTRRACVICSADMSEKRTPGGRHTQGNTCSDACRAALLSRTVWYRSIERVIDGISVSDGCWPWQDRIDTHGYGIVFFEGRNQKAYKVVYRLIKGEIPTGLEPDHTCHTNDYTCPGGPSCRHRRCVNPDHIEPVTKLENWRRGQAPSAVVARTNHCMAGHALTPENTYVRADGRGRGCRVCNAAAVKRYRARKAEVNP